MSRPERCPEYRWLRSSSWLLVALVGCSQGGIIDGVGGPILGEDDESSSGYDEDPTDGSAMDGSSFDPDATDDGADTSNDPPPPAPGLPDLDCEPQPPWYYPKDPIVTGPSDLRHWRWIEVPGMKCANNTQGGFFANFTESDHDLLIFFGGGGVCYDPVSCLLDTPLLLGMGPFPELTWGLDAQSYSGVFDRSDPTNPFRDANFAFFPHCTGDGHTANKVSSYPGMEPIQQVGYGNVQAALTVLGPTFETAQRVTVAGFSAGGIGALANYHQIAWLFECLGHPPPLLIDDAGPVLRKPFLSDIAQSSLQTGWGLDETFAEVCPECSTQGYHLALERIQQLHPGARTALVCAYDDGVVGQLYSALNLDPTFADDPTRLQGGLLDYAGWTATLPTPPDTRHREFYYHGDRHGALVVAPLSATPGLSQFLQAQLDDAPGWSSVIP